MGSFTADEINFQRLLDRSERLCAENISFNIFKLGAALKELEEIYSRLEKNRNITRDVIEQYERDLYALRTQIEAEQEAKKNARTFSDDQQNASFESELAAEVDGIDIRKAKSKAAYHADLRKQLLGGTESPESRSQLFRSSSPILDLDSEEITRREAEKQENLANELFGMARLMKQTYSTANVVIKEDNATLSRLHQVAESHKGSLSKESKRLEEYAYRSWCDCLYIVGICAIIMSFLAMVLVMRVFSKKY